MNFLKEQRASFYIALVAAIVALVGFIAFCITNSIQGYGITNGNLLIFAAIVAIILICVGAVLSAKYGAEEAFGANLGATILSLIGVVLLIVILGATLFGTIDVATAFTTYDKTNPLAAQAFYTRAVCIACNLIAAILLAVAEFQKQGAKN